MNDLRLPELRRLDDASLGRMFRLAPSHRGWTDRVRNKDEGRSSPVRFLVTVGLLLGIHRYLQTWRSCERKLSGSLERKSLIAAISS